MGHKVKEVFVNDDALHVVRGSEVWRFTDNGKELYQRERVQFTDGGASEEFVNFFTGELVELLEASAVYGAELEAVKDAIKTTLVAGLMRSFEHLRKIHQSVSVRILSSTGCNSTRTLRVCFGMHTKT